METVNYILSAPAYAIIINYKDEETNWADARKKIFGSTKNPDPGSARYDFTIGRRQEYNVGTNVIHSSDAKTTVANEIGVFTKLIYKGLKIKKSQRLNVQIFLVNFVQQFWKMGHNALMI